MMDVSEILKFKHHLNILQLDQSVTSVPRSLLLNLEESFLSGEPLAYLMGFSEFYRHRFYVSKHVLIPRPETEYLVDLLVRQFQGKMKRILDVGVGSGAILLSLLDAGVASHGVGVDVSENALEVTAINAARLRLRPDLYLSDRLTNVRGDFDLIVSNPPYIKSSSHRKMVQKTVNLFEPSLALYLEDLEYEAWFETFFQQVKDHLDGHFLMEGHELEVEAQAKSLERLGFKNVSVLNDQYGVSRFIQAENLRAR